MGKPRDISHFVRVRQAREEDEQALGRLLIASYGEAGSGRPLPLEWIAELRGPNLFRDSGRIFVLELGQKIVGGLGLIAPQSPSSRSWLFNSSELRYLAVDRELRGFGFGSLLLAEAERAARGWASCTICAHVLSGQNSSVALLRRYGFLRDPSGDLVVHGLDHDSYQLPVAGAPKMVKYEVDGHK